MGTQNIYDDEGFLAGYGQLPRSVHGLDGAPEWPTLRGWLTHLDSARVVDLGCGFGWFARWASSAGASSVLGIDVSTKMLDRAAADTDDPKIDYRHADLESVALPESSFDCAFSSLTLHYISDLARLVEMVFASLVPGGLFVFSVEHPLFTAPSHPEFIAVDGRTVWPVDGYLDEGTRTTNWFTDGVRKQHRTIASYLATVIGAGFEIAHIDEWGPSDGQLAEHPEWINERHRPPFLLAACRKPRA